MADPKTASRIAREVFLGSMLPGSQSGHLAQVNARLADRLEDVHARAGEVVFRAGDPTDAFFFVASGGVSLTAEGKVPWTFGPRSVVGTIDAMASRPRTRTAIVTADAHLLRFRSADWLAFLEDNFDLACVIIQAAATSSAERGDAGWPSSSGSSADVLSLAPPTEVAQLSLVERMLALRGTDVFVGAHPQTLAVVAKLADELHPGAGDVFVEPGTSRGTIHVVVRGAVETTRDDPPARGRFGSGSVVGGPVAFHDGSRFLARAVHPSVILAVTRDDFFDVMEDRFDLVRSLLAFSSLANERARMVADAEAAARAAT